MAVIATIARNAYIQFMWMKSPVTELVIVMVYLFRLVSFIIAKRAGR